VLWLQISYSYEGRGHELRADQAAMDYSFMLPSEDDPRLFHIDALASQGQPSGNKVALIANICSAWLHGV